MPKVSERSVVLVDVLSAAALWAVGKQADVCANLMDVSVLGCRGTDLFTMNPTIPI